MPTLISCVVQIDTDRDKEQGDAHPGEAVNFTRRIIMMAESPQDLSRETEAAKHQHGDLDFGREELGS